MLHAHQPLIENPYNMENFSGASRPTKTLSGVLIGSGNRLSLGQSGAPPAVCLHSLAVRQTLVSTVGVYCIANFVKIKFPPKYDNNFPLLTAEVILFTF